MRQTLWLARVLEIRPRTASWCRCMPRWRSVRPLFLGAGADADDVVQDDREGVPGTRELLRRLAVPAVVAADRGERDAQRRTVPRPSFQARGAGCPAGRRIGSSR